MAWGQYIDHDMTGFPVTKLPNKDLQCCNETLDPALHFENGGPCFPITISSQDDFFDRKCMEFIRSSPFMDNNDVMQLPREQINSITSYVDASTVYGSTDEFTETFKKKDKSGLLEVGPNNMLPKNNKQNCKRTVEDQDLDYCMAAGDHRANVFLGLGMFHTVFHREHNRLVEGLRGVNPGWDGDRLFEEARKINGAIHQHITYNEYIPSFLSEQTLTQYRLKVNDYTYNPTTNAQMSNAFSTAAFRFGHSQIQSMVEIKTLDGKMESFKMEDTLMRPHLLLKHGPEGVCMGMAQEKGEAVDHLFVKAVTDRLFEKNGTKKDGLDLLALNIQRGRDHGLGTYNDYREFCGLGRIKTFEHPDLVAVNQLKEVYNDVDDIDLFIGGMAERHMQDSLVGPTFACILAQQFHDMKFGDRFWYETTGEEGFTAEQLAEIRNVTMCSVMCANTKANQLQDRLLYISDVSNPIMDCKDMKRLNLDKWRDATAQTPLAHRLMSDQIALNRFLVK